MTNPLDPPGWSFSMPHVTPLESGHRDPITSQFDATAPHAEMGSSPTQEEWVHVDPSSYSNPYTDAPVYTSGPQPAIPPAAIPTATPAASVPGPYDTVGGSPPVPADPMLGAGYRPEKGELKIRERRSWKTWQLLTAVVIAAVLGMWFNGNAGSPSGISNGSGAGGTSRGGYTLPPAAGSHTGTGAPGATGTSTTSAATATSTTAEGATTSTSGSASTTAAAGSPPSTAPVVVGPATVLVPEIQQTGNWTSPAFTIAGGTWNIGWAFQCVPVPTATPTFQIFVVNNGAAPGSTPAVTSSAGSGSAVTPLTSTGSQQIIVQTSASCRWAVKVTGSSS